MYSAYKLDKQDDNIQPWRTPFPIWNHSVVPCPVLTVASWPAYRFLKRQVRWSGIPISFRIFDSLLWATVKGFGIVNKAEIDVSWNSLAFSMIHRVLAIWSVVQKTKIMASGPTTSWEIDGETVQTVSDFIFGGSKMTADSDCSHEIKRRLLLGRKVMTNIDSIFKSRDITLPSKVFPVVIYGCESWTEKKA